jgi:hypothetical protein
MIAVRAGVVVVLAALLAPFTLAGRPAGAQEADCTGDAAARDCHVGVEIPGSGSGPSGPSGTDSGRGGGGARPSLPMSPESGAGGFRANCNSQSRLTGADATEGQRTLGRQGPVAGCNEGPGIQPGATFVEFDPQNNAAPAPPAPEAVAADLYVEAQARMRAPEVVADPAVGTPSIITLPVFVQVTNWVDRFTIGPNCVQGVCVTLTAEPTLTFDPGEPASEPIVCDPPGTRFDPNGPDPAVQAGAPGACAYAYQARTGADERPDAWPGQVTVTWDVSWTAGVASGEFDPQVLSTAVPREVDEVQTVVRD